MGTRKYIQNPGVGDYFNPELFREWHGMRETTQRVCVCAGVGPRNYIQTLDVGDYFDPPHVCVRVLEWGQENTSKIQNSSSFKS